MTELENIKQFFENDIVKDCVSVTMVEKKADLPIRSLYSFLKGKKYRYLTPDQIDRLVPVIVQIGYRPLNSDNQFI